LRSFVAGLTSSTIRCWLTSATPPSFSSSTEDFGIGLSFEKPHDLVLANHKLRFGFREQASVQGCAANSCGALPALVSVCIARTRYLKPDSHFHPSTMLHFLSPAEWRLPPPHTQLRSTPPGRSKPSVYGPMAARSVGSVGKSSGSRTSCRACSDVSRWSAEYKSTSPSDGRSVKIPFSGTAVFFWSDS
jgi:hypothetical protein